MPSGGEEAVMSDKSTTRELSPDECATLLAENHFGRIAVVVDAVPVMFPVNYLYADGRVIVRSDPGSKLTGAAMGQVAFEIDHVDEARRTGWSVVVKGTGYDVTDSIDQVSVTIREFPVDTWAPGRATHWIRIEPHSVSGREIGRA
jgi:nitroimidazol reductase NimA-like FMN-containing flavoprotein (pyridoxamine 5'-phosphate oxidase superfamily)